MEENVNKIKEEVNMNNLHNDHMERALERIYLREPILVPNRFENISNEKIYNISNMNLKSFENYVVQMFNTSQKSSMDLLSTMETSINDNIDQLKLQVRDIKQEQSLISSLFEGWKTSNDTGKLYVDLKKTVDILKFSTRSKSER